MNAFAFVAQYQRSLRQLDVFLQKGAEHAAARKFDPSVLVQARLAPDMFPLARQVQSACDTAKLAVARVTGKEAPSHPDTETTLDELRARVATVLAYLDTFTAEDFAGIDSRVLSLPRWEGRSMTAVDYLVEYGLPNFFFHFTTAYAILRANGVDLGKRDYLGALTMR